jgi:HEAT repeat protein
MRRGLLLVLLVTPVACTKATTMAHYRPVGHWVAALHDADPKLRRQAVTLLGNVGTSDPAAVPAITAAIKDPDALVRREAVLALLKQGSGARQALPALREACNDPDVRVRLFAARALSRIEQAR